MMNILDRTFEHPLKHEETAIIPFMGGIVQYGYQCGMIWGAVLASGAQAYRLLGPGPQTETRAVQAAKKLIESFYTCNNNINCLEITDIDKSSSTLQMIIYFLFKGGTIGCIRRAMKYGPVAFGDINFTISAEPDEVPATPVSCTALLAKKTGASGMHTVMAAGLAGGIGLSGGACGALGAAIWILSMKIIREGNGKITFKNPRILDMIEKFIKCTDYEFECYAITGRKFKNVSEHAAYICNGGCEKIINELAALC